MINRTPPSPSLLKFAFGLVALALAAAVFFVFWKYWPDHVAERPEIHSARSELKLTAAGQFGDQYGALSSLLTGFTLIGVAYGVMLQWAQLRSARKEAAEERAHRENEAFERRFFQMLTMIERQVENVEDAPFKGIQAIRVRAANFLTNVEREIPADQLGSILPSIEWLSRSVADLAAWNKVPQDRFLEVLTFQVSEVVKVGAPPPTTRMLIIAIGESAIWFCALRIALNGTERQCEDWHIFLRFSDWTDSQYPKTARLVVAELSRRSIPQIRQRAGR